MTGFIQEDLPMINGPSFASLAYDNSKKRTRQEKFLAEMAQVIPWADLLGIIRKHYPKAGNGRQPMPLERMLRIYFMQQWYGLSDPGMEDALYDIESMRRFAHIDLQSDAIPDDNHSPVSRLRDRFLEFVSSCHPEYP